VSAIGMAGDRSAADQAAQDARADRVLDALEARCATCGIRAVVISDLARELQMSTKTIYRTFPSKDTMVLAMVRRWTERVLATRAEHAVADRGPVEQVRSTVHELVRWRTRFSDDFWRELRVDHPEAWELYREMAASVQEGVGNWLARSVRPGVDPVLAREVLGAAIRRALQPDVRGPAGLDPTEAIDAVVDLWVHGAVGGAPGQSS